MSQLRNAISWLAGAVAGLGMLVVPAAGQSADPSRQTSGTQAPGSRFAETIDVRLVTIPVLVRDRSGRPVTDLRADEIQVVEGRTTYDVAFVNPFYEGAEARKGLPQVRLMSQVPGGVVEVAKSSVREPRHMLIVADLVNDPSTGRKDAVDALGAFLESELDESFRVALMVYDGNLRLAMPFTHDRRMAVATLQRLLDAKPRGRETTEIRMEQLIQKLETCRIDEPDTQFDSDQPRPQSAGVGLADRQCLRDTMYEYAGETMPRAQSFLNAVEGAVRYAAGLENHTFVLTIGGNVGFNPSREVGEAMRSLFGPTEDVQQLETSLQGEELIRPQVERVMEEAYRANVSLSFLDLTTAPLDSSARQRMAMQPGFRPMRAAYDVAQQGLDEMAASTGGAYLATTKVAEGLRESVALAEGGYHVGFYVKDRQPMTQRRIEKLALRTTRSGITLKHRRAFEGAPAPANVSAQRIRGIIQVGFPEEQEYEGVRGNIFPLRLVLDPRDLNYKETEAQAQTEFTVHLRLVTPKGAILADSYHVLSHAYPADAWRRGDFDPPELRAWADLPDGDYFAEAIVTVPATGSRGTIRRHVAVRNPKATTADATPVK